MNELTLDIFRNEPFTAVTMTDAIRDVEFTPQAIGDMGLFDPIGVPTTDIVMWREGNVLSLVPTTERAAPPVSPTRGAKSAIMLPTFRLAQLDRIHSYELLNLLRGPGEVQLQNIADEIAQRQQTMLDALELTRERMRLGVVQGKLVDADGSVLVDYYTQFGFSEPAEIGLNIANIPAGQLRYELERLIAKPMVYALKGRGGANIRIGALMGDAAWADLIRHPDVVQLWTLQAQATGNTDNLSRPMMWDRLNFGAFTFINYRGTDDGSMVNIGTDKIRFFPIGVRGAFKVFYAPGESIRDLGTRGRALYSWVEPDKSDNQEYVDLHVRTYPNYATTVPNALLRARRGA